MHSSSTLSGAIKSPGLLLYINDSIASDMYQEFLGEKEMQHSVSRHTMLNTVTCNFCNCKLHGADYVQRIKIFKLCMQSGSS